MDEQQQEVSEVDYSHDICGYCGYDNGVNGESRQGWDCGYCGSN